MPEIVLCNIVIAALNKNVNYHILSMSLDGKDAGTIKLEELCNKIVRFYNDTNKGWGLNPTADELGSGKRNGASKDSLQHQTKKLEKQLNSMQARMNQFQGKPGGANGSIFSRQKRKSPSAGGGGNPGGSKRAKGSCDFCGKPWPSCS